MKIIFPHLGSMHIFCKAIAETAGIPYIVPPETSRETLRGFECNGCGNQCEVIELPVDHQAVACWDDLCGGYRQTKNGIGHGA
ncbi:MAG: hypothetical protein AB1502_18505 [Thermodesulfobacteriota bacterium]